MGRSKTYPRLYSLVLASCIAAMVVGVAYSAWLAFRAPVDLESCLDYTDLSKRTCERLFGEAGK